MAEQATPATRLQPALAPELEARIAAFERDRESADFDAAGWFWMVMWGVAVPLLLLVVGWWA